MEFDQQIQKAIEAHGEWKQRLNVSITTGRSSHTVASVCQEDQCALGRWLFELDDAIKATSRWQCVRATHAAFHRETAQILELALDGNQRGARSRMTYSSPFTGLSNKLIMELTAWKREPLRKTAPLPTASPLAQPV
jgi:hypothetical protein